MILFSFFFFALTLILDRDRRNAVYGTRARLLRFVFDSYPDFVLGKGHASLLLLLTTIEVMNRTHWSYPNTIYYG